MKRVATEEEQKASGLMVRSVPVGVFSLTGKKKQRDTASEKVRNSSSSSSRSRRRHFSTTPLRVGLLAECSKLLLAFGLAF